MNFSTQKKYLKIVNTHDQIISSLGKNAPYISESRIIELVTEKLLIVENIKLSRSVFYKALKYVNTLKGKRLYME